MGSNKNVLMGRLSDWGWQLFASFLRFLPQYVADLAARETCIVVQRVLEVARGHGFKYANLQAWSAMVLKDFDMRNVPSIAPQSMSDAVTPLASAALYSTNVSDG